VSMSSASAAAWMASVAPSCAATAPTPPAAAMRPALPGRFRPQ
jgi:hypothetical protein